MTQRADLRPVAAFRAFDRWLMLRHPRIWLTRVHQVLLIGLLVYIVTGVLGQYGLRMLIMPRVDAFLSGPVPWWVAGTSWDEPYKTSLMLSAAISSEANQVLTRIMLCGIAMALAGALASLFWIRQQSRFSIEAIYGRRQAGAAWIEWLCGLVCAAVFALLPFGLFFALAPGSQQAHMKERTAAQSVEAVRQLAEQKGFTRGTFVSPAGVIDYEAIGRVLLGKGDSAYQLMNARLLTPLELNFGAVIVVLPNRDEWRLYVGAGSPEQRYLEQMPDMAYIQAYEQLSRSSDGGPMQIFMIVTAWIVGVQAYLLYAARRVRSAQAVLVVLVTALALPVAGLVIALIVSGLADLAFDFQRPPLVRWLPWLVPTMLYAVLLLAALLFALQTLVASAYRRINAVAALALPILLGFLPLVLLICVSGFDPDWLPEAELSTQDRDTLLVIVLSVIPFLHAPFLPLLDKILLRLRALPRLR